MLGMAHAAEPNIDLGALGFGALVRSDLCCNVANEDLAVGKADLLAPDGSAAGRRIRTGRLAFGSDTEACDRLAGGSVRVKLSLQIFQVERKVQDVLFLNPVFS